ncbi:hypothetical protein GQ44DRAFT_798782 [Phaeosphaeriaceae sp. PMI808]|nr:hypothetical protein GQ44DRAFT_798782 [Phaeosphaeriaceae sp. PMI808]
MFDVDTSGISRDLDRIVRPGVRERRLRELRGIETYETQIQGETMGPSAIGGEDLTFHIEADWKGDPETLLLCVRHKGRRLDTINPATADFAFIHSMLKPKPSAVDGDKMSADMPKVNVIETRGSEILQQASLGRNNLLQGDRYAPGKPFLIHISVENQPRLRYYGVELYRSLFLAVLTTSGDLALYSAA